jgi:hypothetical protein
MENFVENGGVGVKNCSVWVRGDLCWGGGRVGLTRDFLFYRKGAKDAKKAQREFFWRVGMEKLANEVS